MTTANNDHTGDPMKSKVGNQAAYSLGWDAIFGKKESDMVESDEESPEKGL